MFNKLLPGFLIFMSLTLSSCAKNENLFRNSKHIDTHSLALLLEREDIEFMLVDIRESQQSIRGEIYHIDSIAITRGYLEIKLPKEIKKKDTNIVVYCCTGHRSVLAVKTLNEMGYSNVLTLDGGIKKWVDDRYPLTTTYGDLRLCDEEAEADIK
jgi:rhodanese-related sulfurtransferase